MPAATREPHDRADQSQQRKRGKEEHQDPDAEHGEAHDAGDQEERKREQEGESAEDQTQELEGRTRIQQTSAATAPRIPRTITAASMTAPTAMVSNIVATPS
jgi:type IV secretory pathway VirB10-like protein